MRKLLVGLFLVVILAVVAVVAFLAIPSRLQKWAVERGATMRHRAAGDHRRAFRLRAWPPIEITASDIKVANADWGTAAELARGRLARRQARPARLLARGPRPGRPVLVAQPEANLEVGKDGRRNWDFGGGQAAGAKAMRSLRNPTPIPPFVLGDVRISDGAVAYDDRAAGTSKRAEAIALTIKQAGPDQPVAIDGGLTFEGKPATLTGSVDRPQGAAAGEKSPIKLSLGVPGATAAFDGEIETKAPAANGSLDVRLTAPRELLAWVGAATPAGLPGSATLQGQRGRQRQPRRLERDGAARGPDQPARADAAVDLAQPPQGDGDIALARLDLSPYLGGRKGSPGDTRRPRRAARAGAGWPDTPIELPLPLPVDADLRVHGDGAEGGQDGDRGVRHAIEADRQQAAVTIDAAPGLWRRVEGEAQG